MRATAIGSSFERSAETGSRRTPRRPSIPVSTVRAYSRNGMIRRRRICCLSWSPNSSTDDADACRGRRLRPRPRLMALALALSAGEFVPVDGRGVGSGPGEVGQGVFGGVGACGQPGCESTGVAAFELLEVPVSLGDGRGQAQRRGLLSLGGPVAGPPQLAELLVGEVGQLRRPV